MGKKNRGIQKLTSRIWSTFFVLFSWNFVKMMTLWAEHFHQISWGKACLIFYTDFICIKGSIQKPHGHNFALFWPPNFLQGHFLCNKRGQKWQIVDHLPLLDIWIEGCRICSGLKIEGCTCTRHTCSNKDPALWKFLIFP